MRVDVAVGLVAATVAAFADAAAAACWSRTALICAARAAVSDVCAVQKPLLSSSRAAAASRTCALAILWAMRAADSLRTRSDVSICFLFTCMA